MEVLGLRGYKYQKGHAHVKIPEVPWLCLHLRLIFQSLEVVWSSHSCFGLPSPRWRFRLGLGLRLELLVLNIQHGWTSLAQRTSCSPPDLPPERILEAKVCRGEDAHFGPVAAQMHKDRHSHDPLLPLAPSLWCLIHSSLAGKGCGSPHCTSQAVK